MRHSSLWVQEVAEGVPSYRKVLHLGVEPLISTFDLIWAGGRGQQMSLKVSRSLPEELAFLRDRSPSSACLGWTGSSPSDSGQ